GRAVLRYGFIIHSKSHEILAGPLARQPEQCSPTHEIRLIELDRPVQTGLERDRQRIGINANNDMLLFQTEQALGFYTKGSNAKRATRIEQSSPDIRARFSRKVNLPADFTHKADAHQQSLDTEHFRAAARHVRECLRCEITISQLRENIAGFRTRQ